MRALALRISCLLMPMMFVAAFITMPAFAADIVRPLVIGHRGASGYLPEHTLESYALAVTQGADFIEPDLVNTKDGVLIARHENEIGGTTDVATKFPYRRTQKVIDGQMIDGWFTEDFTLAEIKTLRAKERLPIRGHDNDGKFLIPTFVEILELRARLSKEKGREIGVYPETKHPTYFAGINLPLEEPLAAALKAAKLDRADAPVFLQSFEASSLQKLAGLVKPPRILLLDGPGDATTDAGLTAVAAYAQGIGPGKQMIVPVDANGQTGEPTDLIVRAHRAGLKVHPYTFRPEPQFLPASYGGDPAKEYCQFARLGIDGLFTDTPDLALKAFRESCPMPVSPAR
jgi:glycerophosphoryl diester phosphodiesterase